MFTVQDRRCFLASGLLITAAYLLMAYDPQPNGFGLLTLWIAPPLLMVGLFLPVPGIIGWKELRRPTWPQRKISLVAGLGVFIISLIVYILTLEPTASLWDCSEFIASAYKLQVPHTPGTPLSLLFGRLFSMLAPADVSKVAWYINLMSALFSALAVWMLFRIIFGFACRMVGSSRYTDVVAVLSAMSGSLCLAFSDTFWFSAVEAETYGPACFFMLLLVWLVVTGAGLHQPARSRRLILIFYIAGLAYCVHPMCLLAMTILPFTWLTANRTPSPIQTLLFFSAGLLLVFGINRLIAVGYFEAAFAFDRFFVNTLHFPFYSGAIAMTISGGVLAALLVKSRSLRPFIFSLLFLMAGFLPYLLLFIRSSHNPPIDETNPENLALIKAYMNRESYPSSPLLFGPYFDAKVVDVREKALAYYVSDSDYKSAGSIPDYIYDSRQTFLPRMYSNDPDHIETYRQWTGLRQHERPDFLDNLEFMLSYQLGHMYLRYFMWNFAGRYGSEQHSSWLAPWDSLGSPSFERSRNQYWMMPLAIGLLGASFHFRKDRRGFASVAMLFLITGLILALYLNGTPNEPRERDYIYVGSFIAFSVWIGLGFSAIGFLIRESRGLLIFAAGCIVIPGWMLYQNFDDHDRTQRTFQVDHAKNILRNCAPNSILFTGGDNDTFPLWYVQEVEGFRTDVRVMVLSYMNTDWYINQLRKDYYDSPAFRLTLEDDDYRQYGLNDVLYVQESIKTPIDVDQYLRLLGKKHPALRVPGARGEPFHIVPSRTLRLVAPQGADDILIGIDGNYITKSLLAILDLVVANGEARPVYFNFTSLNSIGVDLTRYVVQEGSLYRLAFQRTEGDAVAVDTKASYVSLVEQADYTNLADRTVNFNYEDHFLRMIVPVRQSFNELASALLREGNHELALQVMHRALSDLYPAHLRPSYTNVDAAGILLALGERDAAAELSGRLFDYCSERMAVAKAEGRKPSDMDVYLMERSAELLAHAGKPEFRRGLIPSSR